MVAAELDRIIIETNFCSEIGSATQWFEIPRDLEPILDGVRHGRRH